MASVRVLSTSVFAGILSAALTACAGHPPIVAVAPVPAPVVIAAAPALPPGVSPTMTVPLMLPDGSYQTPNRGLSPDATLWHFRVALNVAALACRGAQGDAIVASYNAMLARRRTTLSAAETRFAAEWRHGGGDWRDRYDDAMTRLYNYFSLSPARTAFCTAAAEVLTDAATVPDDALPGFAAAQLPALDRPFTDVYRAFDAWRGVNRPAPLRAQPQTVAAIAVAPHITLATAHPRLELDPSVFQ
ncbi:hypothetical protein [uncultured Sphingomonas sp.]|uniref:hypothetical protein n=1 Tax=uncultured Sphingomonas sp. TaxID=158754 RepID=UPI0035CA9235